MNEAALAIKVTTDASEAVAGLSDTTSGLGDVSDAASSASKVSGQTARALGGLGKGLKLIGQDEAAETLQQAGMALQFVKGTSGLAKLGMEGYAKASKVTAVAQAALNAVMAANPVLLIVIAVVALAAAFVIAYKKSETFRNIVNAAGRAIAKTFGAVVSFIQDHWQTMLVILTGPIGLAVLAIVKHRDTIKAAFVAVVTWVRERWGDIKALLTGPISAAKEAIGTAFSAVLGVVQGAINKVEDLYNKLIALKNAAAGHDGTRGGTHTNPGSTSGGGGREPTGSNRASITFHINESKSPTRTASEIEKMLRRNGIRLGAAVVTR